MDANLCRLSAQLPSTFQPRPLTDMELTNLNWVAGAPVPMPAPVSPTRKGTFARNSNKHLVELPSIRTDDRLSTVMARTPVKIRPSPVSAASSRPSSDGNSNVKETVTVQQPPKKKGVGKRRRDGEEEEEDRSKKPNCSYTSLIGLALMASEGGCLPVSEIYSYIEDEFPYFRNAPDGWKNSIRHNLSLNPAFRKVQDSIRWQGKKGYYWEVVPERRTSVEREVERYLRQEGRLKGPEITDGISPFPSCLQASIPTMPQTPNSVPMCSFQYCSGTQPYYDLSASMLRYYPPPRPLSPPPLPSPLPPPHPPQCASTNRRKLSIPIARSATALLDTDISPSQFAGFSDHTSVSTHSAFHDLFGFQLPINVPSHTVSSRYNCHPHLQIVQSTDGPSNFCPELSWKDQKMSHSTTGWEKSGHSMRLRRQALDMLTLPEDELYPDSYSNSPSNLPPLNYYCNDTLTLDHCCASLEECFMTETCSGEEEGERPDERYMELSEELPLPPLSSGGELSHGVDKNISDNLIYEEVGVGGSNHEAVNVDTSSPEVLASGTVRQKRKKSKGGKRKKPRLQQPSKPPTPSQQEEGNQVQEEAMNNPPDDLISDEEKEENKNDSCGNNIIVTADSISYKHSVDRKNERHILTTRTLRPRVH